MTFAEMYPNHHDSSLARGPACRLLLPCVCLFGTGTARPGERLEALQARRFREKVYSRRRRGVAAERAAE
jgi:hypothetical protein